MVKCDIGEGGHFGGGFRGGDDVDDEEDCHDRKLHVPKQCICASSDKLAQNPQCPVHICPTPEKNNNNATTTQKH